MTRLTLHKLAAMIRAEWPHLHVVVKPDHVSTNRKIPGTRLIRQGKGRRGLRLTVTHPALLRSSGLRTPTIIFEHSSAEAYRRNSEVLEWMVLYRAMHTAARRKGTARRKGAR